MRDPKTPQKAVQGSLFNLPSHSFHNTVPLKSDALAKAEAQAQSQEGLILKYFSDNPYNSFTPDAVHLAFGQQWPITSVRRALTNLTVEGCLKMTGEQRAGMHGVVTNCWIYVKRKKTR